jgi:hypothetical protein
MFIFHSAFPTFPREYILVFHKNESLYAEGDEYGSQKSVVLDSFDISFRRVTDRETTDF